MRFNLIARKYANHCDASLAAIVKTIKEYIMRLLKKSCGMFIEFSIVHKIGYNNAI